MPAFRGPLRSQSVLPLFFLAHALTLAFLRLALALAVGFAFAFPCADLAAPQDRHTDPLIFDLHRVAQAGAQPRGSGSPHPTSSRPHNSTTANSRKLRQDTNTLYKDNKTDTTKLVIWDHFAVQKREHIAIPFWDRIVEFN